jgi:hypothetical protein
MLGAEGVTTYQVFQRDIFFTSVRAFMRLPFPGSMFFEFDGDSSKFSLGKLTEFVDSEWAGSGAEGLRSKSAFGSTEIKHFSIQFLSENVAFHVLAEAVSLSGERLVS